METILQGGPVSRASIAKLTGLSKQTISDVVRQLEAAGWIQETGRTSGHIGRTAVTYEIIPTAAFIAAVDLGGTKVRVALADLSGKIHGEEVAPTDPRGGLDVVRQIANLCSAACSHNGVDPARIKLAVIGVPGAPQLDTGRILLAPNIAHFDTMDVAGAFEEAMGCVVVLENDVNLAVFGESWLGHQGIDNLAFIALGTGIGGGLMVDGELVRGRRNAAGELGFLPFGADPFEAESLHTGALERTVASGGIKARYREITGQAASVPDIFERANKGEAHASSVLDETARYLARGISAICAVADPELVILGGSIGIRPEMVERVRALLPLCFPAPVRIEPSALGQRAPIIGATAIGLRHLHNTLFGAELPDARISLPPAQAVFKRVVTE